MKIIVTICTVLITTLSVFSQPERSKGFSLHMLPERVAQITNEKGGFTVSAPLPAGKMLPAMDAEHTIQYFEKLPENVKKNGIWVVYTHPSSYSEDEKKQLKKLVAASEEKKIPIFTCRASELSKNNWKAGGLIE